MNVFTYPIDDTLELDRITGFKGVSIAPDGRELVFDGISERSANDLISLAGKTQRVLRPTKSKAFEPMPQDIAIVQDMVEDFDQNELWFREILAANTKIDIHRERFTEAFLIALAASYDMLKSPVIMYHRNASPVVAKVFSARVELVSGLTWMILKVYGLKEMSMPDETNISVSKALQTKFLDKVSIGFDARPKLEELPNGQFIGVFDMPQDQNDVRGNVLPIAGELSFVHLGAQFGARVKSAQRQNVPPIIQPKTKQDMSFDTKKEVAICGKDYTFRVVADDSGLKTLSVPDELEAVIKTAHKSVETAKAETETAKTETESAKKETEASQKETKTAKDEAELFRKVYTDNVERFQGEAGLKLKGADLYSEDDLKEMKPERLVSLSARLEKQHLDANPVSQGHSDSSKKETATYGSY